MPIPALVLKLAASSQPVPTVRALTTRDGFSRVWFQALLGRIMFKMTCVPKGTVPTQPSFAIRNRGLEHDLFSG